MIRAVQRYLDLGSRPKIYLILVFTSLILLFCSIWQIKPVIVEIEAPLGLASYLTPSYWIGLAVIVLASIFAFLDRELKKDALFILILVVLGLFLIGIPVFAYEVIREPSVYFPFAEVYLILDEHYIDINKPIALSSLYAFPTYHLVSASILEIANTGHEFTRYWPLFWLPCFVLTTYGIGKRLELSPNLCFLLSFLSLSSWLYYWDYHARTLAVVMFLLLFLLLLTPKRKAAERVAAILLFAAIVLTHGLVALAVLPALLFLSIYRKETTVIILFIAIFGAWYMYRLAVMEAGIHDLMSPLSAIFGMTQVEQYHEATTPIARSVARYSCLSYLALYVTLVMGSGILFLKRKVTGQPQKQVIALFCWAIGLATLVVYRHGGEGPFRLYSFCLVPAVAIIVLSFAERKLATGLMIALMCLTVVLHPLANFAVDASYSQIDSYQLKGSEFVGTKVDLEDKYICGAQAELFFHYKPEAVHTSYFRWSVSSFINKETGEWEMYNVDNMDYITHGKQASDSSIFSLGKDYLGTWPETEVGRRADLIYTNGYFQVYWTHKQLE